jgi:hypothetical protein
MKDVYEPEQKTNDFVITAIAIRFKNTRPDQQR